MKKILLFILIPLILFQIGIVEASTIDDLREEIRQKELEIKELQEKAAMYKQDLSVTRDKKNTLQNQIDLIEGRIRKLQNDIYLTSAKISNASLQIEELSLDIGEKENEIDKRKDSIASAIRALYEYDNESLMEIVLAKDNLSDFLNQVRYLESLQEGIQKELTELVSLKESLQSQKETVEDKRSQLYVLNNQLYNQKQIVNSEKQQKDSLLRETKGQERQYQSLLDDVLKKQQEIQQDIYELEDKLKMTINPDALPEARSGVLSWPLDGILTQNYGITPYSKRLYASGFHNGIDIASSYGEPIRAARDGKILAIGSCGRYAYGNWIAVSHDNGLITFYAHLSGYGSFGVGDNVSRGTIIAYEGNTGYSTGAHLHFGVYVTETFRVEDRWYGQLPLGAHLNPMDYL
ncbi:MAG: peptidoglycan DD-metalloendopeptidase family protein [Candidatus Portnoybacteria bacterium]|nr:peptidoglycan DD-metalloendopeptidase family protein [Candidatus Portnoybacteria bacterium]